MENKSKFELYKDLYKAIGKDELKSDGFKDGIKELVQMPVNDEEEIKIKADCINMMRMMGAYLEEKEKAINFLKNASDALRVDDLYKCGQILSLTMSCLALANKFRLDLECH